MNISPLAVVHPEAKIGQNTTVDPFAVIQTSFCIMTASGVRRKRQRGAWSISIFLEPRLIPESWCQDELFLF